MGLYDKSLSLPSKIQFPMEIPHESSTAEDSPLQLPSPPRQRKSPPRSGKQVLSALLPYFLRFGGSGDLLD